MKILSTVVAFILSLEMLNAATYNVDKDHSDVTFKVKHMMVSNVRGSFDTFSGTFEYDEKTKKILSLKGKVEVGSINTKNVKRDGHLKSSDLFDVSKYPTINYVFTKINGDVD